MTHTELEKHLCEIKDKLDYYNGLLSGILSRIVDDSGTQGPNTGNQNSIGFARHYGGHQNGPSEGSSGPNPRGEGQGY